MVQLAAKTKCVCVSLGCVIVAISAFVVNIISYFDFNDATRCHVAAVTKDNKCVHVYVCLFIYVYHTYLHVCSNNGSAMLSHK